MVVSVVITGIPKNVTISSLALSLDQLFDTNEISSFRTRHLPLNAKGKPQVALDFKSGFDAMAAQEILNGYTYAIDDQEYILRAKVTNDPSLMESDNSATSDRDVERRGRGRKRRSHATDDIDAELTLLKKKLLVVESEKLLIKAQKKVKKLKKKIKNKLSESEAEDEGEPSKKKNKHKKLKRIKRSQSKRSSTSRRRSSSRDSASSVSAMTPPVKKAMKSRNRSSSLSSVSSCSEKAPKMKAITFPVEKKSRSKNRPISISSESSDSSPRRKIPVKRKARSRSQETLALVPYRATSSERAAADARRHTPQPSTSRATERDSSHKRTSRNKSPKMPERRRLRSRSLSRSRSPVGRRSPRKRVRSRSRSPVGRWSPRPSSSRYRGSSPRRSSRWSPIMRRRSRSTSRPRYKDYDAHKEMVFVARAHRVYRPDSYHCSVTEVDSDHAEEKSAGIEEVLEDVSTDKTEVEEEEEKEETNDDTRIVIKMNIIKKKAESIKKIMPVPMLDDIKKESEEEKQTGEKVANYDPEFIKKIMPRPICIDGEIIKKEVDDTPKKEERPKKKKEMPQPILVEIKQEATENENPIATERKESRTINTPHGSKKKPASNPQFHIPIVKILKQMRPHLNEMGENLELKCKVIEVARVKLIARIKAVLTDQPYMNNTAVCALYRKHFPLESDEEFVTNIKSDIANGECDDILKKDDGQCTHIMQNNRNGKGKKRACQVLGTDNAYNEWRKELSLGHFLLNLREMVQRFQLDTEEKAKQKPTKTKKERSESKKTSSDRKTNKKSSKDKSKVVPVGPDDDVVILEKLPEVIDLAENEDDGGVMQAIIKLENDLGCTDTTQTDKKNKSHEIKKARKLQKIRKLTPEKIIDNPEMSIIEIKDEVEVVEAVVKSEKDTPRTDKKRKEKKEKKVKKIAKTDRKAADVKNKPGMSEDRRVTNTTEANESRLKPSKKRTFDDLNDTPSIDIKHEIPFIGDETENAPHVNVAVKVEENSDQREKTGPNTSTEQTLDAIDDALMNEIKQELQQLPNTMLTNDESEIASNVAVKKESGHQIEENATSIDVKPNISKEQTFNVLNDALMNEVKQELQELPETILAKYGTKNSDLKEAAEFKKNRGEIIATSTDMEDVKTELAEPEECIESIENFVTLVTNVIDID